MTRVFEAKYQLSNGDNEKEEKEEAEGGGGGGREMGETRKSDI